MKYYFSVLLLILGCSEIMSQNIQMNFPHFAGGTYEFIIFQGDNQLKVQQDTIPKTGKFELKIPKKYQPYIGMSRWLLTNSKEGGGIDMPISGKDFSVTCLAEHPSKDEDFVYKDNNNFLQLTSFFREQDNILNKATAVYSVLQTYEKTEKNYSIFQQEYDKLKEDYNVFQQKLKNNPSYAAQVLNIFGITKGIGTSLAQKETERAENIAFYIANELDFSILYTSGHWTNVISSWVDIHTQVLKNQNVFVNDFTIIEKRLTNPKLFTDFAGRTAYYLTQKGKDDYIAAIAPIVNRSSKIFQYEGSMIAYKTNLIGTQAPDISLTEHIGDANDHNHQLKVLKSKNFAEGEYKKTLVIFYESGCGPCENLLQQLPGNYENIKKNGVKIIAISADKDEQTFKTKNFPWKDTYCDYRGKEGINFQNYGVIGTPTIFLLDKSGIIMSKVASMDEILDKIKAE